MTEERTLSFAEIEKNLDDAQRFANAVTEFMVGYTNAKDTNPFTIVIGLQTLMADVIASVPPASQELFFDMLDIRKRVRERATYNVLTPIPPHTSNGG